MSNEAKQIIFPKGRFISGSITEPNTKDYDGNPLIDKKTGLPTQSFFIGVAIPKTPGVDWLQEPWGTAIYNIAITGAPSAFDPATKMPFAGRPFAWKVTDGDSAVPNLKGKRPCDLPNHQGNWVISFKNGFQPKMCSWDGKEELTQPDAIKRGYWVQVVSTCAANNHNANPGVYLNPQAIALSEYDDVISGSVDTTTLGLGAGGVAPVAPTMAVTGAPGVAPGVAPVVPATDMVTPAAPILPVTTAAVVPVDAEVYYSVQGQRLSKTQLLAMPGWTEAHLANLTPVA